jgi:2-keto-4-pentenoate hydratase/2-oxohepta-3-ene-1,7-dioic acid hydratase in catechol pathway
MTDASPSSAGAPARVFCIGRNYAEHARELDNPVPAEPVVFMKPVTCLVRPGKAIPFPSHGKDLHHEVELVLRIGAGGRHLSPDTAMSHVDAVTVGFDLTLRDVQQKLKESGQPWEKAKAFEGSAPLGEWVAAGAVDATATKFRCYVGETLRQEGDTREMLFPIPELLAYLSTIWTLTAGDLVFTGTPAGVGPVLPGDRLTAEAEGIGRFAWDVTRR